MVSQIKTYAYRSVLAGMGWLLLSVTVNAQGNTDHSRKPSQYLQEKQETDSFQVQARTVPVGFAVELKKRKDFWYADKVFIKKQEEKQQKLQNPFFRRPWVKTFLWIIITGGFVAALIWYLGENNVGIFRKKNLLTGAEHDNEAMPEDIFSIPFSREIEKAEAAGNFRLALRLYFLQLLRVLADQNIIRYQADKTNMEYLLQIQATRYYQQFFRLTRHFEFSWYGLFPVPETAYQAIREEFIFFMNEIRQP